MISLRSPRSAEFIAVDVIAGLALYGIGIPWWWAVVYVVAGAEREVA